MLYIIQDCYGSRILTWSRVQAIDWLRYCSPTAEVRTIFGAFVARRVQSKI